jgi:hypothetical protein
MKTRNILLAVLCSCATTAGFAQLRLGGKIGMNVSSLKGSYTPGESAKQKIGFHAGLRAEYPLGEASKLGLVGELLFSTQGVITDKSNPIGIGVYQEERKTYSLNYVNMPIMLKYQVLEQLSIEGGPQFGYAINGELKTEITNTADPSQNRTYTQDLLNAGTYSGNGAPSGPYPKSIKALDIGFNLGATYDFSDKVFAQLHYYFGLSDINAFAASNYLYASSTNTLRSSVFQVSLGYRFM